MKTYANIGMHVFFANFKLARGRSLHYTEKGFFVRTSLGTCTEALLLACFLFSIFRGGFMDVAVFEKAFYGQCVCTINFHSFHI